MITARLGARGELFVVAPVRGLTLEARKAVAAIAEFAPAALGVGLSPEELQSLTEYFVATEAEPVVPLTGNETSEVRGLVRFGEARVPNPSVVEALRFASARALAVEPLDPSDERYAALFAEHIGYLELVRRTVRERKVARNPPTPSSPDEFALAWDAEIAGGAGSRRFAEARDQHLADAARRLAAARGRVAVLIDRERFDSVRPLLERPDPEALADA
ncbi:MAG TPA: hypothetical protein VMG81_05940 [Thermoplasmata archaeon]|nr:hypothetical protein [Thermoplasmata archaeon]